MPRIGGWRDGGRERGVWRGALAQAVRGRRARERGEKSRRGFCFVADWLNVGWLFSY